MSSRDLLKSMLVTGGAQSISILVTLIRTKVLALLLGPTGVGLLSIYTNFQQTVATGAGAGLGSSGVREIAKVKGEVDALSRVRRVLLGGHLVQGSCAMALVWVFREPVARLLVEDPQRADEVGLIGIGVLLTLVSTSQTALLRGLRRIADLGRVTVLGSLIGTVLGLGLICVLGRPGLVWFVLAQPLAAVCVALIFTRKLPRAQSAPELSLVKAWKVWKPMARLGVAFMLSGVASSATLLLVRSHITQRLGLDAAGQFAAAWSIAMIYVGFLLQAMGADYYPRLAEVIEDRRAANRLMNDQAQLVMAFGGPILLVLVGGAPWAIRLLYSSEFDTAALLLEWQAVGNVFKLAAWPLGFSFMAAAQGRLFLLIQLNFNLFFLGGLWLGLPAIGLEIAGIAFLVAYVLHFLVLNVLTHRLRRFRWEGLSLRLIAVHASFATILLALARVSEIAAALIAPALGAATAVYGLRVVLTKIGPEGRLPALLTRAYSAIGWPIRAGADSTTDD